MKMRTFEPLPQHHSFMDDVKGAMAKHTNLSPEVLLALASQIVGNIIAMQDQTKYTPEQVMSMVAGNIELGNQAAIAGLLNAPSPGGRQ